MYSGNNPSALRSRDEIVRGFLELLRTVPLEEISVKQIMDVAGLSRQTFYQIFDSKEEILEYYLDRLFDDFILHSRQHTVENLCDAAKLFFAFFELHRDVLRLMIENGKSCVVQRKCREYLHREQYLRYELHGVRSAQEQAYAETFIISGMVAMLEQWIKDGSNGEIAALELARLVCGITGTDD